jgi:methionyl aminopeptidase
MRACYIYYPPLIRGLCRIDNRLYMIAKNETEIAILRECGKRLSNILEILRSDIKPGISTADLNAHAELLIRESGDMPTLLGYKARFAVRPYPAVLCVSVNDEVVNGIPNEHPRILQTGDLVKLDMALTHKGLITDAALTVGVGTIDREAYRLLTATRQALWEGIAQARSGNTVGDIGAAIEDVVRSYGFFVLKDFGGHGVGKSLHEAPSVPSYALPHADYPLVSGMVLAIEPIIGEKTEQAYLASDGYTVKVAEDSRGAHFEHTILVTEGDPEVLTMVPEV